MAESSGTIKSSLPGAFPETMRRLLRKKSAFFSLLVCCAFLGMALFAEGYSLWCSHQGKEPVYRRQDPACRLQGPSAKHWMGTDYLGRDVFYRCIFGARTAVKVGVIASLISSALGVALGILAGYFGGRTDDGIVWLYSTFASMPSLLFILAFSLLVSKGFLCPWLDRAFDLLCTVLRTEKGMLGVYLSIGLTSWVSLCRVVRAETLKLRTKPYVLASLAMGQSSWNILFRHILPNLFHLVIVYFTMGFATAVMTEVIVSFLGLGVQFEPSWGVMISDGQERLWRGIYWEVGGATLFMFLLVLSLNLLGDALRDTLDPRMRT